MKLLFENWQKYLSEGVTDIVYHKTPLDLAENILKTNKFMTSVAFGTTAERAINKEKLYFLSTMRSPVGDYGPSLPAVTFKLDGQKLGERSKAAAVDYWGPDFPTNEMEDRVFTDEPWIAPASKYILEVHIGMRVKGQKYRPERLEELKEIVELSRKLGLPVYLYPDVKTYGILNKTKRLTYEEWMDLFEKGGQELDEPWAYQSRPWSDDRLTGLLEIIKGIDAGDLEDIDKSGDSVWYRIKYDYGGEYARQLANAIHNNKSNPEARESINAVAQKMRALRTDDIASLVGWLQQKVKAWVEEHEPKQVAAEHQAKTLFENWREYLTEGVKVPKKLYHATYAPLLSSILKDGLGGERDTYWEDSVRGVVYLALEPEVAFSYADTSDRVAEAWLDQIVILEVDTSLLDRDGVPLLDPLLFKLDSNVQDNEGDTLEYHGVIPKEAIKVGFIKGGEWYETPI